MGFLSELFGKGKKTAAKAPRGAFKLCDRCGKPIQVGQNMSIMTNDPSKWSIDGMAGYCPGCSSYLCSDHLELRNTTGQPFGPWEIGCKSCGVSITSGP